MEENITTQVTEEVTVARDDQFWKTHLFSAQEFKGSDREYCRRNGLGFGSFKIHKQKLGFTKPHGRRTKAFVKIESKDAHPTLPVRAPRTREFTLPDPNWTAEFIAALMSQ